MHTDTYCFMMKRLLILSLFVCLIFSCGQSVNSQNEQKPIGNALANETSAYLKLHAKNPVYWKPWGEEAITKAKEENKLLIISIGYVSCHWCHVMEEESFSDDSTAAKMNEHFVSIKVDREERPGVDKAYMNSAFLINGSGGWPLNVIAMPDGRPLYAGTYFPIDRWNELLDFFIKTKKEDSLKLESQANSLLNGLNSIEEIGVTGEKIPLANALETARNTLLESADKKWGGSKGSPKFPMPSLLEFQLQSAYLNKDQAMEKQVLLTLDKILAGGIYDHLAGGFFRYSTDALWRVPHFEKMLYDNGQLVKLYANAYKLTKKPSYKKAIVETLGFMEREMTLKEGVFFASIDADSEGEEGKFYIWSTEDVSKAGVKNERIINSYFGIDLEAELDGKHVLYENKPLKKLKPKALALETFEEDINEDLKRMADFRAKRIQPFHDQKIISSWNALMIMGYLQAYEALGEEVYKEKAIVAMKFLMETVIKDDLVSHIPGEGNSYLEDAVQVAAALIKTYENTFEIKYLNKAKAITNKALQTFKDPASDFYFYSNPANGDLVVNIHEITDNVIPGSNSQLALNLFRLGHYFYDNAYLSESEKMLTSRLTDLDENPFSNANWAQLASMMEKGIYEIAITGEGAIEKQKELAANYLPHAIYLGTKEEENLELLANKVIKGRDVIYVCKDKSCRLPVSETKNALELLK